MDERNSNDEIAALKARLSQLERAGKPPSVDQSTPSKANWVWVIAFLICGGALVITNALGDRPDRAEPGAGVAASTPAICNKAWAKRMVEAAERSPLISGMDMEPNKGLIVVVRRAQWEFLSLNEQKVIAAGIDCHIAGPDYLKAIHFRLSRDGPDLYRVTAIDLLRLREAGAAAG